MSFRRTIIGTSKSRKPWVNFRRISHLCAHPNVCSYLNNNGIDSKLGRLRSIWSSLSCFEVQCISIFPVRSEYRLTGPLTSKRAGLPLIFRTWIVVMLKNANAEEIYAAICAALLWEWFVSIVCIAKKPTFVDKMTVAYIHWHQLGRIMY